MFVGHQSFQSGGGYLPNARGSVMSQMTDATMMVDDFATSERITYEHQAIRLEELLNDDS